MDNSQPNPIQQQPQQPQSAAPTQPGAPQKSSGNTVLIIVIVLIVLLFLIPLALVAFIIYGVGNWASSHPDEVQDFVNELERGTSENYVAGTWNCDNGTGSTTDLDNYSTTLKLNKDMTFNTALMAISKTIIIPAPTPSRTKTNIPPMANTITT